MSWLQRTRSMCRGGLAGTSMVALAAVAAMAPACLSRPLETIEPRTTSTLVEKFTQSRVDKIDILLAIDDSGSMADKQTILALAVPDLIETLVNPSCVDADGHFVQQPAGPLAECPADSHRDFEPVLDIHIGVISTSLGPRGSSMSTAACADDNAKLLDRVVGAGGEPGELETYDDMGFLAWDPAQQLVPPGQADPAELKADLRKLVEGVGENGCGYEASLESWYRFLIDPDPYASVVRDGSKTRLEGTDTELIAQRERFLRPDSLVAIIMLSDENDCSFRAEGQGFFTAEADSLYGLKARAECAQDTQDPCCAPCGYEPAECPDDPSCSEPVPYDHEMSNLHCFDQKRRFGYDFLYPISRYIDGLTAPLVPSRDGSLVDNPLLVSSRDGERYARPGNRVFLAGIVGVPWQDIARQGPDGRPSLEAGLKTAAELQSEGVWSVILGDPSQGLLPTDPHMIESVEPRAGANPVTNDRIAAVDSSSPYADAINGHEYHVPPADRSGDLQYACIFDLPASDWVDCDTAEHCDCRDPDQWHKPLCQADDGSYSTTQRRAKAYPGTRQLQVLEGIGDQAIVASICPAEVTDQQAPQFGYRPAIAALTERLKEQLRDPCLSRTFAPDETGQVPCVILEGQQLEPGEACSCDHLGRRQVSETFHGAEVAAAEDPISQTLGLDCFCEIVQLAGEEREVCQQEPGDEVALADGSPVHGWCYLDATTAPPVGNPELVSHCPASEQRTIRFVGEGEGQSGATLFLTCQQGS